MPDSGSTSARPPRSLYFRRVLKKRCPQCGEGRLFSRWARLAPACSACGLRYRREAGSQTGAMYLSAAVTQVFAALVILAALLLPDASAALRIAVGAPVVLVFCAYFLPWSMALWVAVEYSVDVSNREPWTHPRGPGG